MTPVRSLLAVALFAAPLHAAPPLDPADRAAAAGSPATVEVYPTAVTLTGIRDARQLVVTGKYADGSVRDLTHLTAARVEPKGWPGCRSRPRCTGTRGPGRRRDRWAGRRTPARSVFVLRRARTPADRSRTLTASSACRCRPGHAQSRRPWPGAGFAPGTPSRLGRFFGHSRIDCPRAESGISYTRKSASSTRKGQIIPGHGITTF